MKLAEMTDSVLLEQLVKLLICEESTEAVETEVYIRAINKGAHHKCNWVALLTTFKSLAVQKGDMNFLVAMKGEDAVSKQFSKTYEHLLACMSGQKPNLGTIPVDLPEAAIMLGQAQ